MVYYILLMVYVSSTQSKHFFAFGAFPFVSSNALTVVCNCGLIQIFALILGLRDCNVEVNLM